MFDFLIKNKIKNIEDEAHALYLKSAKAIESDSVKVSVGLINKGDFDKTNEHLREVGETLDTLENIEQKYLRLKEKLKHDNRKLLEIAIDWKDINVLHYKLLMNQFIDNENVYRARVEEIIKRFNYLLEN